MRRDAGTPWHALTGAARRTDGRKPAARFVTKPELRPAHSTLVSSARRGAMADAAEGELPRKTYTLEKEHELRLEADGDKPIYLTLCAGTGEIFGCEVAVNQRVALSQQKVALFTWHGATVEVEGTPDIAYVASDTPMLSYLNVHAVLEERRKEARTAGPSRDGPRVLVAGPCDVGKSTLARLLSNYAVRHGWSPVLVDLDLGQGGITCPGALAALPLDAPLPPNGAAPLDAALVYYFGGASPGDNPELYKHMVARLAAALDARAAVASTAGGATRAAGAIINTCGWVDGVGKTLLVDAARALRADVVLVLGAERLHAELAAELGGSGPGAAAVVALRKSGGVVARPAETRRAARSLRTREYFYGPSAGPALCPHATSARFDELAIYRVGGGHRAPASALPLGAEPAAHPLRCAPVAPSPELLHAVLAVSHATSPGELLTSNVAGFLYVTDVDVAARRVTYLAPTAGPLPGRLLLLGSIKWYEA